MKVFSTETRMKDLKVRLPLIARWKTHLLTTTWLISDSMETLTRELSLRKTNCRASMTVTKLEANGRRSSRRRSSQL